jgi:hypothetical protein
LILLKDNICSSMKLSITEKLLSMIHLMCAIQCYALPFGQKKRKISMWLCDLRYDYYCLCLQWWSVIQYIILAIFNIEKIHLYFSVCMELPPFGYFTCACDILMIPKKCKMEKHFTIFTRLMVKTKTISEARK